MERFYQSLYQNFKIRCKLLIDNKYYNPMRVTYNERVNSFDELTLFFMLCSSYYCKYESFRFECFVFQASI